MTQPPDAYTAGLRQQHRDDPLEFFGKALREFFMNRDDHQTIRAWTRMIHDNRWYTEDVIECMQTVLANPPDDLVMLIQENGWVMLPRPDDMPAADYHALYLAWLSESAQRLSVFLG